ncbi:MAG: DUF190 domain-containing protein [Planctomycetota bacterium]|jgi:PII-like signaling protein
MKIFEGHQTLMRIFIGEKKKHGLRKEKLAGATVLRGITGFGVKSHLRSAKLLALSQDLPMVVECVDTRENIDRILPKIDDMVGEGLVTLEKVEVILCAPKEKA